MNKKIYTLVVQLLCTGALFISSVGCGQKNNDGVSNDTLWQKPVDTHELLALDKRDVHETVKIDGKTLAYEFHFSPSDSLPQVVNPDGQRYKDNIVKLIVRADSTVLFKKTFTKSDFAEYVDAKNLNSYVLAGFNYNLTATDDHSALRFIAVVGDPDETAGVNFPVDVRITPDGHCMMEKAKDIETEPLIPGLGADPAE